MRRLVFISPTIVPQQTRFVSALRKYYDADFYFLWDSKSFARDHPDITWKSELHDNCHEVGGCRRFWGHWFSWRVITILRKTRPDILMLGGFSDWANMLAYLWGRLHGCKIVVQTERSRDMKTGKLRGKCLAWRLLHFLYRKVDMVMVTAEDAVPQFRDTFKFGNAVVAGHYPSIIDPYYGHRTRESNKAFTIIFANRLVDLYNPLAAVRIFAGVLSRHPETRMKMNADGPLRKEVEMLIEGLGIKDRVSFLDQIKCWDDLNQIYESCDVMILPAKFSNGNYSIVECAVSGMACFISDKVLGNPEKLSLAQPGAVLPLDEKVFVERVCEAISNPTRFKNLAERSREVYRYRTNEATAKLYYDLFEQLFQ